MNDIRLKTANTGGQSFSTHHEVEVISGKQRTTCSQTKMKRVAVKKRATREYISQIFRRVGCICVTSCMSGLRFLKKSWMHHWQLVKLKLKGTKERIAYDLFQLWLRLSGRISRIARFTFEHTWEPRFLRVHKFWITGLFRDENGHIALFTVAESESRGFLSVDAALRLLERKWQRLSAKTSSGFIAPVFCLHDANPHCEGVRAFLVPNLPPTLIRQIARLKMQHPFDLRTEAETGKSGIIGKTIVDIQTDRILILGNAANLLNRIRIVGSRISCPQDDTASVLKSIAENLKTHAIDPLGSSLLMGGFGAVFAFEAAYIIARLQNANLSSEGGNLIACVIVFLSVLAFLAVEAFEARIVAFSAWWTTRAKLVSWLSFLTMLITAPFAFFLPVSSAVLCIWIRTFGTILVTACFITHLGQIFFGSGLTKRLMLVWWLAMAIFCSVIPLLDLIPTPLNK
ncbi:hypothetical protein BMS3Bbin14_01316 [bacterium BMS3Bbin14]|nr:hypothetical protein BMS3Bbin14_01316 [bacterium BMS3Bbin14]